MTHLLSPDALEQTLREIGRTHYHINHPHHKAMMAGELSFEQMQAWALNRYYYQCQVPVKDAVILSRLPTTELRREWRRRIVDHDGDETQPGGIERWLRLTDGLGLDRAYVESCEGLLPATRFAVDAYVHYVGERSLLAAIASSLTELFSPTIIPERIEGLLEKYPYMNEDMMQYFFPRLTQAPQDSNFALRYVREHADTVERQAEVVHALKFKCGVLWAQLDALSYCYGAPNRVPPGAFLYGKS